MGTCGTSPGSLIAERPEPQPLDNTTLFSQTQSTSLCGVATHHIKSTALLGQLLAVFRDCTPQSLDASEASSHVAGEMGGDTGLPGLDLFHVCAFIGSAPEKLTL